MSFRIFSQLFEHAWLRMGFSSLLAIGAVSGITQMQQQHLQNDTLQAPSVSAQVQQEKLSIKSLKYLPSQGFGFNNLIADWTFLKFLQYYGDEPARQETGYDLAEGYFDVISRRDPRFLEPYIFSSGTLSYELGKPESSVAILNRGLEVIDPSKQAGAHVLWVLRGLDQLLLLGDAKSAAYSYSQASQWAAQSPDAELRKIASTFGRTGKFLARNPDSLRVRLWGWSTVFTQAEITGNETAKNRARNELKLLGATETKTAEGQTIFLPPAPKPRPKPTPKSTASPQPAQSAPADNAQKQSSPANPSATTAP